MQILHVCSEMYPLLKTGGLADICYALPQEQIKNGHSVRVLLPGFPAIINGLANKQLISQINTEFIQTPIKIWQAQLANSDLIVYVIESPELYNRSGNPYVNSSNLEYSDNYLRFALLGYVAYKIADRLDSNWFPQLVHAHDWHAGLAAAYIKAQNLATKTIFTIHNLAYQGIFAAAIYPLLHLPSQFFAVDGCEYYGKVSFLKAGLYFSDSITTVSKNYAQEIQTAEQGCGLNGLLQAKADHLYGILNGIDEQQWNPSTDKLITYKYSVNRLSLKKKNKSLLQQQLNLTCQENKVLFVLISRLTEQKGIHLILNCVSEILKRNGQLVVLGTGDSQFENKFKQLASQFSDSIHVTLSFDEQYAHNLIAAGDVILVPSRFEPCGLTQLYGLKYGTLPLVRKIGGLADTVVDCSLENLDDMVATGFVFEKFNDHDFTQAIKRSFTLYKDEIMWRQVQRTAMKRDFSWHNSVGEYLSLYQKLISSKV
ncbi:MAG: glycogen synthase GlgA [Pseudomonadota bacterium]